jgi:bacteriocin-like protein
MSEEKEKKNKQPEELSEQDLKQVTGGTVDQFLTRDGIKGESAEYKYKDEID